MAKGNNRNVNIGVGLDTSTIASGVQQVTGQMRNLAAEVRAFSAAAKESVEPMNQAMQKTKDVSGLAGAGVMAMSGIISDANYGIRGIANNLQNLAGLMVTLVSQTGSLAGGFRALWSAMAGPLGILLAFTTGITLLERWGMQSDKASKETDKLTDSFAEERIKIESLHKVIKDGQAPRDAQLKAYEELQKLVPELYGYTLDEAKANDVLTASVNRIIAAKVKMGLIDAKIKEVVKLEQERNKLTKDRASAIKDEVTFLEKLGNFFTSTEGGDILYSNVDAAAKRVEDRIGGMAYEIEEKKKEIEAMLSDVGAYEIPKPKEDKQAEKDAAAIKKKTALLKQYRDIQDDELTYQGELQKQLIANNLKTGIGSATDLYFAAREMGTLIPSGISQGISDGMNTIPVQLKMAVKPIVEEWDKLMSNITAATERFAETALVGLLGSIGEAIGGGTDSIKQFGQDFLKEMGSFLQQIGSMLIAYGVAMDAFKSAFSNPYLAIAAGAALVVIGGAIKGAHEKKFGKGGAPVQNYTGGGNTDTYSPYNGNQQVFLYTRLDGRDLLISNNRTAYTQRR